jgi:hypothetical protein
VAIDSQGAPHFFSAYPSTYLRAEGGSWVEQPTPSVYCRNWAADLELDDGDVPHIACGANGPSVIYATPSGPDWSVNWTSTTIATNAYPGSIAVSPSGAPSIVLMDAAGSIVLARKVSAQWEQSVVDPEVTGATAAAVDIDSSGAHHLVYSGATPSGPVVRYATLPPLP